MLNSACAEMTPQGPSSRGNGAPQGPRSNHPDTHTHTHTHKERHTHTQTYSHTGSLSHNTHTYTYTHSQVVQRPALLPAQGAALQVHDVRL